MADIVTLNAQVRTVLGKKVKRLRNEGIVPVVVYGAHIDPVHLQIPYRPLQVALMEAGGSALIDIEVDNGETHTVLVRDVQRHVVREDIMHVDFMAVSAGEKLTAEIPIVLQGESPAFEQRIGILVTGLNSLHIEVLPRNLPSEITVDISGLAEIGDAINVGDLNLSEDITILAEPEELIARINPPTTAPAAAEGAGELGDETEITEPEVVARGKSEEQADEE